MTPKTIADILNITVGYLNKKYKEGVFHTAKRHLDEFRITVAKDILTQIDLKIEEVAVKAGIPDIRKFDRQFKKYTGMSPADYKKRLYQK